MAANALKRVSAIEELIALNEGKETETVYGVVDRVDDGIENIVRCWKGTIGNMVATDDKPTILIGEKFEPAILKHKKYKLFFGGRAGMKSIFAMDAMTGEVNYSDSKVFVLRERMKALKESIYAGINDRVSQLNYSGFSAFPSLWEIRHRDGGRFTFGGMQNIIDMKGSFNYKFFLMEEAAKTKQQTIDTLGPTLRGVDGAELWYLWNPESANDPMSTEFIIPYQADLDRDGYYEDEYHLIIKTSYLDNPWFMGDESLRTELNKDKSKVESGRMSKARFNHIWHGGFNDGIEGGLIEEDWFDACVDAHKKLGIEPRGAVVATHDPADTGDAKTICIRHGIVFTYMEEIESENGNRALDIACGIAINHGADKFGWDCDGMGVLLRDQIANNFNGKRIDSWMFRGSHGVDLPEMIYEYCEHYGIKDAKKQKDVFKNRRAQRYVSLADRVRRTWEAVTLGTYHDPDTLISFSSDIKCLQKLRSEMCRLPIKPNNGGTIELYTKQDMKKGIIMSDGTRQVIPSPNLADGVMMSEDVPLSYSIQSNNRQKASASAQVRR